MDLLKILDGEPIQNFTDACAYCGKVDELRPYGKEGVRICFDCGQKPENKATTIQLFNQDAENAGEPDLVKTFEMVEDPSTGHFMAIKCLVCKNTSWNHSDVLNLYCGHCHRFHQPNQCA